MAGISATSANRVLLVLALAAGLRGASAPAADWGVAADPARCVPVAQGDASRLPPGFQAYLPFVKTCAIALPPSAPALFITSVWVDEYYLAKPGLSLAEDIPLPLLTAADGRRVGTLPAAFPGEAPITTTVAFDLWQDRWPQRIRVTAKTDALGDPPEYEPLIWDAGEHRFQAREGEAIPW